MSEHWRSRAVSPADVVSLVGSGATLFLHGACATPLPLVEALCARRDLEGVRLYHLHTTGPAPFAEPGREREFRSVSLFTGAPLRRAVNEGRADFVPIFLSDIPALAIAGDLDHRAADSDASVALACCRTAELRRPHTVALDGVDQEAEGRETYSRTTMTPPMPAPTNVLTADVTA